jgi:hypothetical protein
VGNFLEKKIGLMVIDGYLHVYLGFFYYLDTKFNLRPVRLADKLWMKVLFTDLL